MTTKPASTSPNGPFVEVSSGETFGINPYGLIDQYRLALDSIFNALSRQAFQHRLASYLADTPIASPLVQLTADTLVYKSESFVPLSSDARKHSLFFILGNPAPESVALEAMFAYEGRGKRYHRFWQVLDTSGLLRFPRDPGTLSPHEKMGALFRGDYASPFNIYILPFYSFPTPAAGAWSGVAGIQRLFGTAFAAVEAFDAERVSRLFDTYLRDDDIIVVFQKGAYSALSRLQIRPQGYNYHALLQQPLMSKIRTRSGTSATLICLLPTRLMHSHQTRDVLSQLAQGTLVADE